MATHDLSAKTIPSSLPSPAEPQEWPLFLRMTAAFVAEEAAPLDEQELTTLLQGVDPKEVDPELRTPLMHAASRGALACVRWLLPHSDVDATDWSGRDALMHASIWGREECVGILLPLCDPTAVDQKGLSALLLAAEKGHTQTVQRLLPVSDPYLASNQGDTALMLAVRRGDSACVSLLIAHSRIDQPNAHQRTALQNAASLGHEECLRLLIEAHPQPQWLDYSLSALVGGVQKKRIQCLNVLAHYWPADVAHLHEELFAEALHAASEQGEHSADCISILLTAATVWAKPIIHTALSRAVRDKNWDAAERLLPHADAETARTHLPRIPQPRQAFWLSFCEREALRETLCSTPSATATPTPTSSRSKRL